MKRYDTYKDSGVQWLGEIPGHWKTLLNGILFIEDVRKPETDDIPLSLSQVDGVIPTDEMKESSLKTSSYDNWKRVIVNDLVLNRFKAHLGVMFASNYVGMVSFHYGVFKAKMDLVPKYYEYLYHTNIYRFIYADASKGMTVGLQNLSNTSFYNVRAIYPPKDEQHSIVSYLDDKCGKIDEWVTKKQKEVEHLQELKQRVIADAVTRGLNPHVKMKTTNIPWLKEIPEHWEFTRNKSLLKLTDEKVGDRKDITLLSLTKQGVIIRDLSEGKGKFPKDFDTYLVVRPNNLVFCLFDVDETPRTVGLVRNYGMLTGAYTNFEVNEALVLPEYIYNYYLQVDNIKGLRPYYTGLRKVVKTGTFLQIRMPIPPLDEQRAIVSYITEKTTKIDTLTVKLLQEIESIKEYKQRLISDVVTGQIKVN